MRVLVAYGSKRGSTREIAEVIGDGLRGAGFDVDVSAADDVTNCKGYAGVVVGGALYANRWHRAARRFVDHHERTLRTIPVWLFSSGPLDDSAERGPVAPSPDVDELMERVGAQEHVTFGGRLRADARGFPASAMAKTNAGDWRRPDRIRAWATAVGRELPTARPKPAVLPRGRSWLRLALHGLLGALLVGVSMPFVLPRVSTGLGVAIETLLAVGVFVAVSLHYFKARGAREPVSAAWLFAGLVAALGLPAWVMAGTGLPADAVLAAAALPLGAVFVATWATGEIVAMMPRSVP